RGIPPYDLNGTARKPNAVCATRGLQHEAGPAESALNGSIAEPNPRISHKKARRAAGKGYLPGYPGRSAVHACIQTAGVLLGTVLV
ncbi:MAG: hypothetical protein ACJ8G3_19555, partial [Burkholderiaceae bacterium]